MSTYKIIGLMSGTSLDGVDICCVKFFLMNDKWHFDVEAAKTFKYEPEVLLQLKNATKLSALELFELDQQLGKLYGCLVKSFVDDYQLEDIDAIASHGHTIFHQPQKSLTVQIGCGVSLAKEAGIAVINDFRKKDVIYGGQGAPLVPIGDLHLFSQFADTFLNIGGFSNFSVLSDGQSVKAFDICPSNILINYLTRQLGLEYDDNGAIACKSTVDVALLNQLNDLPIYQNSQPQSLGWEWVEETILPLLMDEAISIESAIATVTEHSAFQMAKRLNEVSSKSVYITGGGAKNGYLIERLKYYFKGEVIVPEVNVIDFKEAIIFAFLGVLFFENVPNCLPSVTGASKAVVGGTLHLH